MIYRNKLPLAASELENGWYYVEVLKPAPIHEHLLLIHNGRMFDALNMFPAQADYVILGPCPTLAELESATHASDEVSP